MHATHSKSVIDTATSIIKSQVKDTPTQRTIRTDVESILSMLPERKLRWMEKRFVDLTTLREKYEDPIHIEEKFQKFINDVNSLLKSLEPEDKKKEGLVYWEVKKIYLANYAKFVETPTDSYTKKDTAINDFVNSLMGKFSPMDEERQAEFTYHAKAIFLALPKVALDAWLSGIVTGRFPEKEFSKFLCERYDDIVNCMHPNPRCIYEKPLDPAALLDKFLKAYTKFSIDLMASSKEAPPTLNLSGAKSVKEKAAGFDLLANTKTPGKEDT